MPDNGNTLFGKFGHYINNLYIFAVPLWIKDFIFWDLDYQWGQSDHFSSQNFKAGSAILLFAYLWQ
jgi:hypothetical protein